MIDPNAGQVLLNPTGTLYVDGSQDAAHDPDGTVVRPYRTIQAAIDAAADYNEIRIAYGTYVEQLEVDRPLWFLGDSVTVAHATEDVVNVQAGVVCYWYGPTISVNGAGKAGIRLAAGSELGLFRSYVNASAESTSYTVYGDGATSVDLFRSYFLGSTYFDTIAQLRMNFATCVSTHEGVPTAQFVDVTDLQWMFGSAMGSAGGAGNKAAVFTDCGAVTSPTILLNLVMQSALTDAVEFKRTASTPVLYVVNCQIAAHNPVAAPLTTEANSVAILGSSDIDIASSTLAGTTQYIAGHVDEMTYEPSATYPTAPLDGMEFYLSGHGVDPDGRYFYTGGAWELDVPASEANVLAALTASATAKDLGGGAVTSGGTYNGVDVENHDARHAPGGADALTTAAPGQGVGGANAEGVAATFARSDHNHTLRESGGPTDLALGAVGDGELVRRSGATVAGRTEEAATLAGLAASAAGKDLGGGSVTNANDLGAATATLSGLDASRIMASDGSKTTQSILLSDPTWVTPTLNQINAAANGTGGVTLSTPQDIHSGATPTFNGIGLGTGTITGGRVTESQEIPIEAAEDGTSPPAAAELITHGSGNLRVRKFDDASIEDVIIPWKVPDDMVVASGITFNVEFVITEATAPSSEGVAFDLAGYSLADGDDIDGTDGSGMGSAIVITKTGMSGAQYDWRITSYSAAVTIADITAGERAMLRFRRLTSDPADTYAQDVGVVAINIRYTRQFA